MQNSLETILKNISKNRDLVSTETAVKNMEDPHAKRVRLGKIKNAKDQLIQQFREYRSEIQKNSVFLLAIGSNSRKFAFMCEDHFDCFAIKADQFYSDIVENIPEALYKGKTAGSPLFDYFSSVFEKRAMDIEIVEYPAFLFESKYRKQLNNKDDVLALMKRAFNDKVGAEVVGLDAIDRVATKALEKGYAASTVAVVLYTEDQDLLNDLARDLKKISDNVFVACVGEESEFSENLVNRSLGVVTTVNKTNIKENLGKIKQIISK